MASTSHQTSLDMNALSSSFSPTINQRNYGISIFSTPSDCLPICITMLQSPQATPSSSPQNLGKTILGLTFQAILALFISSPTSSPPFLTHLFGGAVLISFAVSFAALFLQNSFPRIAHLFEKIGALFAAIGVCIIASFLLVHQNFAWICWLACAFSFIVFGLSFK